MMELPQFSRAILHDQLATEVDQELWQPTWRCFCCEDTGKVADRFVVRLIPDYDLMRDKPVLCQNRSCNAGDCFRGYDFDLRFVMAICAELHRQSQNDWRESIKAQFKYVQKAKADMAALGGKAMLGTRGRDENDEREIQIRKEEIEISLQKAQEGGLVTTDAQTGEMAW